MRPADWPTGKYRVILADPPWQYRENWGNGAAEHHYATMGLDDLKALPVGDLALDDAALLLWTTDPQLPDAIDLMRAWGFTYKTVGLLWVKLNASGRGYFVGTGYYTRGNAEPCLLGVKGRMTGYRQDKGVERLIVSPRREHSRKPDEQYRRIERLYPGPYCELFARQQRRGWTVWGNQTETFTEQMELVL